MFRLILYGVLFFFVWKILQFVGSILRPSPPREEPRRKERKPPEQFSNIQDAEFEDITHKKEPGGEEKPDH
jgi:hypothetical protein